MEQIQTAKQISEIADLIGYLTPEERQEVEDIIHKSTPIWIPQPGPQTEAYYCPADILYYGGQAGGGKSDLLLGLALTQHNRSIIYRRESTQNVALIDRLLNEILKNRSGWNGQKDILRLDNFQIEFGSCKNSGDEIKYQGRPHDFKGFDEITHFLELQFRFLCGWLRSGSNPTQRKRIVCAGNPPTTAEGEWIVDFWGAWLDPTHKHPAHPGELRWYTTIDGEDVECESGKKFQHKGKWLQPLSRTFIPSSVQDNVFMVASGYEAILQALPEPLRSQMLNGDFTAGMEDDQWQVIPTKWVEAAMDRWSESGKKGPMTSMGVDCARGGSDNMVIAKRHNTWFDRLKIIPGKDVPNGPTAAGFVISELRDGAPVHVDIIGVGGSVYDHLEENNIQVIGVHNAERSEPDATDRSGKLKFVNDRAMNMWRFREALDPEKGYNIALPPSQTLKRDLCTPMWFVTSRGIQIESKDQIIHGPRLHKSARPTGKSPDEGDAVINAWIDTKKKDFYNDDNIQTHADGDYNYFKRGY